MFISLFFSKLQANVVDYHTTEPIEAGWHMYESENKPSMVHILACRLVGAKPLSKPVLDYC